MNRWLVLFILAGFSGCVGDESLQFHEALLGDDYKGVIVEVDYVPGYRPTASSLLALQESLHELTDKRVVLMQEPTPIPRQSAAIQRSDLPAIHAATKDHGPEGEFVGNGWVYLHVIFTNGMIQNSGENIHVVGTTLQDEGAIFIFKERFQHAYRIQLSQKLTAVDEVERVVVLHELGHAMGLVNYGAPMTKDHAHHDHNRHSSNPESVMYPILPLAPHGLVYGPLPKDFDEDDRNDLAALRLAA